MAYEDQEEQDAAYLDQLMEDSPPPEPAGQVAADPVAVAEKSGNEFWEEIKSHTPLGTINPTNALGAAKVGIQGIAGMAKTAEGVANLGLAAADMAENFAADFGIGSGDFMDEGTRIKFVDDLFGKPTNVLESAARFTGQYMAPYMAIASLSKGASAAVMGKALFGSFAVNAGAHDKGDKILSNMIAEHYPLAAPIANLLAIDPDDSAGVQAAKAGVEGAIIDLLLMGMGGGMLAKLNQNLGQGGGKAFGKSSVKAAGSVEKMAESFTEAVHATTQARKVRNTLNENVSKGVDFNPPPQAGGEFPIEVPTSGGGAGPGGTPPPGGGKGPSGQAPSAEELAERIANEGKIDAAKVAEIQGKGVKGKRLDKIKKEAISEGRGLTKAELKEIGYRGRQSDKKTIAAAEKIFKNRDRMTELLNSKLGTAFTDQEIHALQMELEAAHMNRVAHDVPLASASSEERMALSLALDRLDNAEAMIRAAGSEGGRTLRSFQINATTGSPEHMKKMLEKKVSREYDRLTNGIETLEERVLIRQQAEKNLDEVDRIKAGFDNPMMKMVNVTTQLILSNYLSNPLTHLVNVSSNAAKQAATGAEYQMMAFAAKQGIGDLRNLSVGEVYTSAISTAMRELFENPNIALHENAENIKFAATRKNYISADYLGVGNDTVLGQSVNKIGISMGRSSRKVGKAIDKFGKLSALPGYALQAEDAGFRYTLYRAELAVMAQQKTMGNALERYLGGIKKGTPEYKEAFDKMMEHTGSKEFKEEFTEYMKNPSEKFIEQANNLADEGIFTKPLGEDVFLGKIGKSAQNFVNSEPYLFGSVLSPFIGIGINLNDQAIKFIPGLNLIPKNSREALFSKNALIREKTYAKMGLGLGLMTATYGLIKAGHMVGAGPRDPKMRKSLDIVPNTFFGVPTKVLGPLGIVMDITADTVFALEGHNFDNKVDLEALTFGALGILTDGLVSNTFTDNMPKIFETIKDIANGDVDPDAGGKFLAKLSTSIIPVRGAVKTVAGIVTDPPKPSDVYVSLWEETKKEWKATIGWVDTARYNLYGEEIYGPPGLLARTISPVYGHSSKYQDVTDELVRLEMTGEIVQPTGMEEEDHLAIQMPSKVVTKGSELPGSEGGKAASVKYTPEEYAKYVQLAAGSIEGFENIGDQLRDYINSPEYSEDSDLLKKGTIKDIIRKQRLEATNWMRQEPRIQDELDRKNMLREDISIGIK